MEISSKALISSILSSTLLISNLATPALAAGTSKVTLNIETPTPEVVSVKVPTEIPITLKNNGDIEVPQDLKITNLSSTTAVKAESIQVEGLNGWSVKDYSTDFTSKPENTQELGLQLRGDNSDDSGNINLTPNNWVIAEDSTLPLNAKAKLPTQNREQSDVGEIAQVNYTFAIADGGEESHSITNDWDKTKVIKDSVTPVTFDIYSTSPDTHIVSVQSDNEAVTLEKAANTFSDNEVGSEVWNVKASKLGIANITATLNTGETTKFTVNVYELNIPEGGDSGITVDVPDKNPGDSLATGDITIDVPIKNADGSAGTITVTPEIPEGTPPLAEGENNINVHINIDINISINVNITINVNGGGQEPSEQFTVTYITDGNGTVSEDSRKFNSGANLTFPTANANEGYTFNKWVDTTTGLEVTGDTIVTSNMEVKATFNTVEQQVTLESIEVTNQPNKTEYTEGENFDSTGMEITAHYSNGSTDIVDGWTVLDGNSLTAGKNTITVQYSEGGIIKECTVNITVNKAEPEVIEIELTADNKDLLGIDGTETELDLSIPIEGTDGKLYQVVAIGDRAFERNNLLENINLSGVKSIGEWAFSNCTSLTTVQFSNSLTDLGKNSFWFSGITSVIIPNSLVTVGDYAFAHCSNLESIEFEEGITVLGKNMFVSAKIKTINIPNSLQNMGDWVFANCEQLNNVSIEAGIQEIPECYFIGCTALEQIDLPDTVKNISKSAFSGAGLKDIDLSNIQSLGTKAFANTKLTQVFIPNSITEIPEGLFNGCKELTKVVLPSNIKTLPRFVFYDCNKLSTISIPSSVKSIGTSCFYNCVSLNALRIPNSVTSIESNAVFYNVPHIYYTGSAEGAPWGALAIN